MKKTLHLIFQTHWDREWYFSYEKFRYRLMHVIDRAMRAIENHEIEYFILDGQTLPLEDYLEVCEPSDKKRMLALIEKEKMIIGPWYIAMDEFLVHGESMIRNLEIGRKLAGQYGKNQQIGYLPDTFGHIGQMPQILKNFGIDNAIMWRGVHVHDSEFIWRGTDHEELFTLFLVDGYYHPELNQADRVQAIKHYLDKISPYARTSNLLMTAGGDHLMPIDQPLHEKIAELHAIDANHLVKVSSYESYLKDVRSALEDQSLLRVTGELRDNSNAYILPNVLSTRSYLKVLNQTLEDEIIRFIEPLMALTYLHKSHAPHGYLELIWKTILQNQPHDSICGCSVDEVHRENEMRGEKATQMMASFIEGLLNKQQLFPLEHYKKTTKSDEDDDLRFSVFNPHPYRYDGMVKGTLWLKGDPIDHMEVIDEQGQPHDIVIERMIEKRRFTSPLDYPPFFRQGYEYQVTMKTRQLKPLTFTMFTITPHRGSNLPAINSSYQLENEYLHVTLTAKGTLDVIDKIQQKVYRNWHGFYACMDSGDSYNYAKPEEDTMTFPTLIGEPKHQKTPLFETLSYHLSLEQPESLDASRKRAVSASVTSSIDIVLTLFPHERIIRVKTTVDQHAKDQRLRIQFPLGIVLDTHMTDSAFELVERISNRKEEDHAERLKEVPVVVDPSLSMVYGMKNNQGIVFYHRGLHETQMVKGDHQTIAEVTLIRSVSHLSRDDFGTRGGAAGPNLATPEAQSIRLIHFDYAFGPADQTKLAVQAYQEAMEFRHPPRISRAFGDVQPILFEKVKDDIMLSSCRLIDDKTIEVRLWNPKDDVVSTMFHENPSWKSIEEVTMDGRFIQKASCNLVFKPHQIKTLHITYKNR